MRLAFGLLERVNDPLSLEAACCRFWLVELLPAFGIGRLKLARLGHTNVSSAGLKSDLQQEPWSCVGCVAPGGLAFLPELRLLTQAALTRAQHVKEEPTYGVALPVFQRSKPLSLYRPIIVANMGGRL